MFGEPNSSDKRTKKICFFGVLTFYFVPPSISPWKVLETISFSQKRHYSMTWYLAPRFMKMGSLFYGHSPARSPRSFSRIKKGEIRFIISPWRRGSRRPRSYFAKSPFQERKGEGNKIHLLRKPCRPPPFYNLPLSLEIAYGEEEYKNKIFLKVKKPNLTEFKNSVFFLQCLCR